MMEGSIYNQAFLLLLLFCAAIEANAKICNVSKWVESTESVTVYHEEPVMESYRECTIGGLECTEKTRVKYLKNSRVIYRVGKELRNVSTCCHGYSGTPPLCNDVDECQYDNGGCVHYCHNTEGSYHCSCYDGYQLSMEDKRNCIPMDNEKHYNLKKRFSDVQEQNFYFAVPRHHYTGQSLTVTTHLHVTNLLSDESISYTLQSSSAQISSGTISAESSNSILLSSDYTVETGASQYRNLGILLNTTGPASAVLVSSGASATGETPLYPYEQLDEDEYEYYAVSTGSYIAYTSYGFILLVGIADTTNVTLEPTVQLEMANDTQDEGSSMINVAEKGSITFTIKRMQSVYIRATVYDANLSGTKITSNNQLAVITGHECGNIPATVHACEHVMEQIPPTLYWGKQFMVSPFELRTSQFYQITASKDSTTVKHTCGSGTKTIYLSAGDDKLITTGANKYCYIEASKPVLVTQMSASKDYDGTTGDPDISVVPEMERYLTKEYTFHVPNVDSITAIYLNIVSKTKDTFTLNSTSQNITWNDITGFYADTVGYGADPIPLAPGSTTTIASSKDDTEYYILVYGFADYKAFTFTSVYSPDCNEGYQKIGGSCIDIDECDSSNNGGCQQRCVNTLGSFLCFCNSGYTSIDDGAKCEDYNECLYNNGGCSPRGISTCVNTPGSHYCSCSNGYQLDTYGHTCISIKQCPTVDCPRKCVNTPGSYSCECLVGFTGKTCTDINECDDGSNGGCDQYCHNTVGSYYCTCSSYGYELQEDGTTCKDINECNNNNGGCDHTCTNTPGSYECSCLTGYVLQLDGKGCAPDCPSACDNHCYNCASPNYCICDSGWTGSDCCTDIDECADNNGGCPHVCHNSYGSFICTCDDGYEENGNNCDDINECSLGTAKCSHYCTNTIGSYFCYCKKGYELDSDGETCVDTNECGINNGGCDSVNGDCINAIGSYYCTCNEGYQLDSDGHTCSDIDECTFGSDECDSDDQCINNEGSYTCNCPIGYHLADNNVDCEDLNECATNNGGCDDICNNTDGSYTCQCTNGRSLDSDNHGCSDTGQCDFVDCAQICYNLKSTYHCGCKLGYKLNEDQISCDDINECIEHISGCNHICNNTIGSYKCSCNPGYTLDSDGKTCNDINECDNNNGGCDHTCHNLIGSYYCSCNSGYELNEDNEGCSPYCANSCHHCTSCASPGQCVCHDGWTGNDCCTDINECDTLNGGCEGICHNTPESYYCTCEAGYNPHGKECIDIDECAEGYDNCDQVCTNTVGSYECSCNDGYVLGLDKQTCIEVHNHTSRRRRQIAICPDACGHCDECSLRTSTCICVKGWTGNDCCNDIDECATNNGGCEHNCTNTEGSFTCSCDNGYRLGDDGLTCEDVNECLKDSDNECNQYCTNTHGSYLCYCKEGYELAVQGGFTCIGTDKCLINNGGCDDDCVNTEGGYNCTCNDGYVLDDDGHTCNDIDECKEGSHGCSHECYNNDGSYSCDCETGYELDTDQETCVDTNECADGHNGGCDHKCNNTEGSYSCYCNPGFTLDSDKHGCSDHITECDFGTDSCSQICHNSHSSYYCTCKLGYTIDETNSSACNDINECTKHVSGCSQVCTNNIGSYTCDCYDGYTLNSNGKTCDEINECLTNNGGCDQTCENTPLGSYTCSCKDGYILDTDKHACTDIDECQLSTHTCDQSCYSVEDECSCSSGYQIQPGGTDCEDIDECDLNTDHCEQNCHNTYGSYACSCNNGYTLDSNGYYCTDIDECLTSNGGCDDTCTNTPSSYQCGCDDKGYELGSDGHLCVDINECDIGNDDCDQICANTIGSYNCSCLPGYKLNSDGKSCFDTHCDLDCHQICYILNSTYHCACKVGYTLNEDQTSCDDVNECLTSNGGCDDTCTNTPGSYQCGCDDTGYELGSDGHTCADINECDNHKGGCEHTCVNTDGSYHCECDSGYELDGDSKGCSPICADAENHCLQCVSPGLCQCETGWTGADCIYDIDECNTLNGGCQHNCVNTPGSFACYCDEGFTIASDGLNCDDIDECSSDSTNECNQVCNNTIGSYNCSCYDGYQLGIDDKTCLPIPPPTHEPESSKSSSIVTVYIVSGTVIAVVAVLVIVAVVATIVGYKWRNRLRATTLTGREGGRSHGGFTLHLSNDRMQGNSYLPLDNGDDSGTADGNQLPEGNYESSMTDTEDNRISYFDETQLTSEEEPSPFETTPLYGNTDKHRYDTVYSNNIL